MLDTATARDQRFAWVAAVAGWRTAATVAEQRCVWVAAVHGHVTQQTAREFWLQAGKKRRFERVKKTSKNLRIIACAL